MTTPFINDNIYPVGSIIRAKENPNVDLLISSYLQRAYFCSVLGNPKHKHTAYFEKELIPPSTEPIISFIRSCGTVNGIGC